MQDFCEEGIAIQEELIQELHSVQSREQLIAASPRLKRLFDRLGDTMIAALEYREKHPSDDPAICTQSHYELNETLRTELNRIYRMDDTREILEKTQEEALNRVDAFEKKLKKNAETRVRMRL